MQMQRSSSSLDRWCYSNVLCAGGGLDEQRAENVSIDDAHRGSVRRCVLLDAPTAGWLPLLAWSKRQRRALMMFGLWIGLQYYTNRMHEISCRWCYCWGAPPWVRRRFLEGGHSLSPAEDNLPHYSSSKTISDL